ncbi:hypothetical protein SNOG_20111 [Parastagonospora nodorum SN15]|uniref:Uncharacterized protein n=1 Tax=Phaeosphaeria nodorum (strain SN15 / ATCC MYA-4574 / FGSC 10173) TaxID=321614 RepID=A9JXA7_PHANO|nr:hypothetical protein SNOG_20111 [Parastagonospora nodorum SN15]EDP89797.1 hypothetical protein SNOG_20111 [Parastagonospora nodorum SN15]
MAHFGGSICDEGPESFEAAGEHALLLPGDSPCDTDDAIEATPGHSGDFNVACLRPVPECKNELCNPMAKRIKCFMIVYQCGGVRHCIRLIKLIIVLWLNFV